MNEDEITKGALNEVLRFYPGLSLLDIIQEDFGFEVANFGTALIPFFLIRERALQILKERELN